jgi:hypothetical protein
VTATLAELVARARGSTPNHRIDLRDPIAAHGAEAVDAVAEWLADPQLTRFAVRVIGRAADLGSREPAITTLLLAREEATPDQCADIDAELHRLGALPEGRSAASRRAGVGGAPDTSVPGWMMRTDRTKAGWIWSEVRAGRLRQGWGYDPSQDLVLLRDRRERGFAMSRDEDWAWPNRRMLADEPDGMQIGDLVLLPHLPDEWRWSVVRIRGAYRFEIDPTHHDYGHILPVEVVAENLRDPEVSDEIRRMRAYPARLRRLSRSAYEDVRQLIGRGRDA